MKSIKRAGCAVATLALAMVPVATASATDVSEIATFSDGLGNLSMYDVDYDGVEDITYLDVALKFDDTTLENVLNQQAGKGSLPGAFYGTVDPGYNMYAKNGPKIYKSNIRGEFYTQEAIDAALADDDAYYLSRGYWESTSNPFWPDVLVAWYRTDCTSSGWARAYYTYDSECHRSTYQVNGTTMPSITIRQRLLNVLGLDSADELVYGENWRLSAPSYTYSWVYASDFDESAEGSARWHVDGARVEYFTISTMRCKN